MTDQRGFTIIEMAIVLVVIGLLIGGGLVSLGPIIDKARWNQTNSTLDQIESALVSFVIRNNRLPCPADGSLNNANANYGVENGGAGAPTNGAACSVATTNSVIPWRTLGLDETYSVDGWGNRISYFAANPQIIGVDTLVDDSAGAQKACVADSSGANCTLCLARTTATAGASTRATVCDPILPANTIQGLSPSYPYGNYLAVYVAANPFGTELTTLQPTSAITAANANVAQAGGRAAYVLISHGRSGWYGWTKGGNQIQPPGAGYLVKAYNANGSAGSANAPSSLGFVQGTSIGGWPPGVNLSFFDDIVRWRTPAMIIQLCGSGACGNP